MFSSDEWGYVLGARRQGALLQIAGRNCIMVHRTNIAQL
jgi:hypothetical protein